MCVGKGGVDGGRRREESEGLICRLETRLRCQRGRCQRTGSGHGKGGGGFRVSHFDSEDGVAAAALPCRNVAHRKDNRCRRDRGARTPLTNLTSSHRAARHLAALMALSATIHLFTSLASLRVARRGAAHLSAPTFTLRCDTVAIGKCLAPSVLIGQICTYRTRPVLAASCPSPLVHLSLLPLLFPLALAAFPTGHRTLQWIGQDRLGEELTTRSPMTMQAVRARDRWQPSERCEVEDFLHHFALPELRASVP